MTFLQSTPFANINRIFFVCLLMQFLFNQTVNSQVYKSVDENGKISYSDKKTESDETINLKKTPISASDNAQQLKKQQKLLDIMQQERHEKSVLKQQRQQEKARQQQRCATVRKRLKKIKDASLLYEKTDDPNNPRILSNIEREAEEKKNERYLNDKC